MHGNMLCGSSSRLCEIPAGRLKPGWQAKTATSDAPDRLAENKRARDKAPIRRNAPGTHGASHKSQTGPNQSPRPAAEATTSRGAALRRSDPRAARSEIPPRATAFRRVILVSGPRQVNAGLRRKTGFHNGGFVVYDIANKTTDCYCQMRNRVLRRLCHGESGRKKHQGAGD